MNNQKQNNYGNHRGYNNRNNSSNSGFKKNNSKGGDFKKKPNNNFKGNPKGKKQPKAIFYQKVLYMSGTIEEQNNKAIPTVRIDGKTLQNANCVHQIKLSFYKNDFTKEELDVISSDSLLLIEIWKFEDKIKLVFILNNKKNIIKYFEFNKYYPENFPIIVSDVKEEKENVLQKTCIYTLKFYLSYIQEYNNGKIEFADIENKQILRHLKGILKSKT